MEREVDTLLEDVVFLDYDAFEQKPWNTYLTGCLFLFSLFLDLQRSLDLK